MTTTRVAHPSVADRRAKGADARIANPPVNHAGWVPADDRPDPVAMLEEQNVAREQDLVPVRHGRMAVSPFTFYRGAAKIMATDLAGRMHFGTSLHSKLGGFALLHCTLCHPTLHHLKWAMSPPERTILGVGVRVP